VIVDHSHCQFATCCFGFQKAGRLSIYLSIYLSNETDTFTMTVQGISWQQDGIDTGWFVSKDIGSVRSRTSYRPGGWWFLAKWLPDAAEHDIGPFKTKAAAISEAERLAAQR